MSAATLMVMGSGSSVGKSLLVAALCRIMARRGVRVAPFKAQNMSNNAAVCADGAEVGRAQALQARAAGLEPCADMNPVLLKPEGQTRSQVIVLGKVWDTLGAARYFERKAALWSVVTAALDRLRAQYDLVIIEGAGSPVELNLKDSDIVNMAVAKYAQSPVVLVGDIDKGGIFAQLLGTLALLPADERALVKGLIVNKFRGDRALFADGVRILESRGETPVLGVVPFLADLGLPEEDAASLDVSPASQAGARAPLDIAIIHFPHIANFDDFDPLRSEPGVQVRFVSSAGALGNPSAVILPGTKTTMADLAWLRERGFDRHIQRLAGQGVAVAGICGGYQMLGQTLRDPDGVESSSAEICGLGLLPVETTFALKKLTQRVSATLVPRLPWMKSAAAHMLDGYEIHMGRTVGGAPWLELTTGQGGSRFDGAASPDGRIWGCYLHGLFGNGEFRRAWLQSLTGDWQLLAEVSPPVTDLGCSLDRLANAVEHALDMKRMSALCRVVPPFQKTL